jgi:hypothetical protein
MSPTISLPSHSPFLEYMRAPHQTISIQDLLILAPLISFLLVFSSDTPLGTSLSPPSLEAQFVISSWFLLFDPRRNSRPLNLIRSRSCTLVSGGCNNNGHNKLDQSPSRELGSHTIHQVSESIWSQNLDLRTILSDDVFDIFNITNDNSLAAARAVREMSNSRDMRLSVGSSETACFCTFQSDGRRDCRIMWQSRSTMKHEPPSKVIAAWKGVVVDRTGELEVQILGLEHCS